MRPPDLEAGHEPKPAAGRGRPKPRAAPALARFAVVGGCGVLVNLAVLWVVLDGLGAPFPVASALGTEVAIVANYVGNELWTFHLRRLSVRRLAKFNASALLALALTVTAATLATRVVPPLAAQLVGIGAGSGANFLLNFGWTWKR